MMLLNHDIGRSATACRDGSVTSTICVGSVALPSGRLCLRDGHPCRCDQIRLIFVRVHPQKRISCIEDGSTTGEGLKGNSLHLHLGWLVCRPLVCRHLSILPSGSAIERAARSFQNEAVPERAFPSVRYAMPSCDLAVRAPPSRMQFPPLHGVRPLGSCR